MQLACWVFLLLPFSLGGGHYLVSAYMACEDGAWLITSFDEVRLFTYQEAVLVSGYVLMAAFKYLLLHFCEGF